jgi:L-amino acid N-acyltransferase YncA
MLNDIKNLFNTGIRFLRGIKRPSKARNEKLLQARHQTIDSFAIRELVAEDLPALAALHVQTWNETYGGRGPSIQIREQQWREQFQSANRDWFVLVIEDNEKMLVGFAKGQPYSHADLPEFNGELNKIYIRKDYQRLGLGRKLVERVAQKFLSKGITNMVLFGIPQNPSCVFHEAMGGERLHKKGEVFQGGYCWRDLTRFKI